MAKKIQKTKAKNQKLNLPKWAWWGMWVVGILACLFLILYASLQIWLSTWKTYRNDEFGFSFRYPSNWYMGGTDINKTQLTSKGVIFFWVDKEKPEVVQGTTETKRSPGNVEVWIEMTKASLNINNSRPSEVKYGNKIGNTFKDEGGLCGGATQVYFVGKLVPICRLSTIVLQKWFDLKSGYYYNVSTLSSTGDTTLISQIKVRYYYTIGSLILGSFRFD